MISSGQQQSGCAEMVKPDLTLNAKEKPAAKKAQQLPETVRNMPFWLINSLIQRFQALRQDQRERAPCHHQVVAAFTDQAGSQPHRKPVLHLDKHRVFSDVNTPPQPHHAPSSPFRLTVH
jgi:hypothetical protein